MLLTGHVLSDRLLTSSIREFALDEFAVLPPCLHLWGLLGNVITPEMLHKGTSSPACALKGTGLAADCVRRSDQQCPQLKQKWKMHETFWLAPGISFRKPLLRGQGCCEGSTKTLHKILVTFNKSSQLGKNGLELQSFLTSLKRKFLKFSF